MPSITSKRRQLCSIEEAWNLPISLEMSSRQQQHIQHSLNTGKRRMAKNVSIRAWSRKIGCVESIRLCYIG